MCGRASCILSANCNTLMDGHYNSESSVHLINNGRYDLEVISI